METDRQIPLGILVGKKNWNYALAHFANKRRQNWLSPRHFIARLESSASFCFAAQNRLSRVG